MPQNPMQDADQETGLNSPPPISDGFMMQVEKRTSGYRVTGPLPLPAEPSEAPDEEPDDIPDLTTAIKHMLAIDKANPLGENAAEQMDAGYKG